MSDSQRTLWQKRWGHGIAAVFCFITKNLSDQARWKIAGVLSVFVYDWVQFRRFTVLKNITQVFPEMPKKERVKMGRLGIRHSLYNALEFGMTPSLTTENIDSRITIHGLENYQNALAQGRGVLVMSLHVGHGDMAISTLALKKIPVHVISKKFSNGVANEFWFGVREGWGARFIDPHGPTTAFDILKACKKNEGVVFVVDQFMGPPYGIESTFFGKKTGTAYGLALFELKTKAPVVPLYIYRDEKLHNHLVFEPPIKFALDPAQKEFLSGRSQQPELIRQMVENYNREIERMLLLHPEQWMWIHRRWKTCI